MAHIFAIGGITPENEGEIMARMLLISGMQRIQAMDDGVSVFMTAHQGDRTRIAIQVQLAIGGTGATVLAGGT